MSAAVESFGDETDETEGLLTAVERRDREFGKMGKRVDKPSVERLGDGTGGMASLGSLEQDHHG